MPSATTRTAPALAPITAAATKAEAKAMTVADEKPAALVRGAGDADIESALLDGEAVPSAAIRDELNLVAATWLTPAPIPRYRVTYRVEVWGEPETPVAQFRTVAASAFSDPRGWALNGLVHIEEAAADEAADFVLALSVPEEIAAISDQCTYWATGEADASCTAGNLVMINDIRWRNGAINDPFPLAEFRVHELNHEVGHWFGEDHWTCLGGPAPVNQQQFRHLYGCLPNPWPLPWEQAAVALRLGLIADAVISADAADFVAGWTFSDQPADTPADPAATDGGGGSSTIR